MIGTDFRLATASLKSSKVRTLLTIIAVIIGVASYVLVTAFVDGFESTVASELDEFGGNLVTVNPCDVDKRNEQGKLEFDFVKSATCPIRLSEKDLADLESIDGVKSVAPLLVLEAKVSVARDDEPIPGALLISTNHNYPIAFNQSIRIGRFFEENEQNKKVVIGHGISENMFNGSGLGSQLKIRDENYTIVAIMEDYSISFSGGFDLNQAVFVPLSAGKILNNGVLGFMEIDIQLEAGVDADEYVGVAQKKLLENYGGEDSFSIVTQSESLEVLGNVLGLVKSFSQVLAYVMLAVGGTVISLIMLIIVKERTREIGIRKSIGATNGNILFQFIIEAVLLSWVGSTIGIAVAFLIGLAISSSTDISPVYTLAGLVTVFVISTVIGTVSGLIPAAMAAKKDPVQALRDE